MTRLARELSVACAAVREAARLTRAVQARLEPGSRVQKDDQSPVTVADYGAQALVCARLAEAFPADPILGEEDATSLRAGGELLPRVLDEVRALRPGASQAEVLGWIDRGAHRAVSPRAWTLDPIDGTKGFLRGEQYAVGLGLIEAGQVVLAVMACPNQVDPASGAAGALVTAVRGQGAWQVALDAPPDAAPVPIRVSREADPTRLRVVMSVDPGHSDQERTLRIAARLGMTTPPRRLDSLAKYALVARGEAEVYFRIPRTRNRHENVWDHAAGVLLVEAAGGTVSDLDGRPLDFGLGATLSQNRGILTSHGPLHRELLAALQATEGA